MTAGAKSSAMSAANCLLWLLCPDQNTVMNCMPVLLVTHRTDPHKPIHDNTRLLQLLQQWGWQIAVKLF
jgi:hypothetical protein